MNTYVLNEADREELILIACETLDIPREQVSAVVREIPKAMAKLIARSAKREDGSLRAEITGNDIVILKLHDAETIDTFGTPVTLPLRYVLYRKAHAGFLDLLEAELGVPVRNG